MTWVTLSRERYQEKKKRIWTTIRKSLLAFILTKMPDVIIYRLSYMFHSLCFRNLNLFGRKLLVEIETGQDSLMKIGVKSISILS